jgi:hypothetical protein
MTTTDAKTVMPQPLTVEVSGKDFDLSPLTPNDFARVETFITEQRLKRMSEFTRFQPLSDEVRSKAISEIVTKVVTLSEVLTSPEAQMYIVWLAIKQAGKPSFDKFKDGLSIDDFAGMLDTVLTITGLLKGGEPDPLDGSTTTTETAAS